MTPRCLRKWCMSGLLVSGRDDFVALQPSGLSCWLTDPLYICFRLLSPSVSPVQVLPA